MANTDMTAAANEPAIVDCTDTNSVITLAPDRAYTFTHTGLNVSGSASTERVYVSTNGTEPTATMAAATRKAALISGGAPVVLGPGLSRVDLKCAANSAAVMVQPSEAYVGRF